jgi:HEAT repeat protein
LIQALLLLSTAAFGQDSASRGSTLGIRLESAVAAGDVNGIRSLLDEASGAPETAVRQLVPLLNHYNPQMVEYSALALVRMGGPEAISAVIARARKAATSAERENLVAALKTASNPAGSGPFFSLLQDPDAETMYDMAVEVLSSMGTSRIVNTAEGILSANPIERVRRNTLRLVGGIGNAEATDYIGGALARSSDTGYKSALAVALGKIGTRESVGILIQRYDQGDETEKGIAARAMSYVNRDAALPLLLETLASNRPEMLLQGAAKALRNFSNPDLIGQIDRLAAAAVSPLVRDELISSREAILQRANGSQPGAAGQR